MRSLILSVLVVACGSEPTAFSSVAAHSEPDAASSGGMLATGGTSTGGMRTTNTGGSVATGGAPNAGATGSGGFDASCGPRPACTFLDFNLRGTENMQCASDADCCHGVPCDTVGYNPGLCRFIHPPACTPGNEATDCPCGWRCTMFTEGSDPMGPDGGHFCTPPR